MIRFVFISTSATGWRLRVSIQKEGKKFDTQKAFLPTKASCNRLNRILEERQPFRIFIDPMGPSLVYIIPKAVYPPPTIQESTIFTIPMTGQ